MPFKARSNDQNKVIVVGISKSLDDAGLSDMFGLHGTVAEAKVVLDEKKQSRGFGFVTYASAAAKNKAIKHMNKSTVDGRVLTVRDVIPKADREGYDPSKDEKQKVGVCWAFQKGLCDKGDACKYPHEVKDGEYGSCFEFVQSGKCKRGDECKFAHTGAKAKDVDGSVDDKKAADPEKPRVCFAFQTGKCHRGKACMFVHNLLEDSAKEPSATDSKKRKREDDPKQQLAALVAAEEKALKAYEVAKKERQDLERQLGLESKQTALSNEKVLTKKTAVVVEPVKKEIKVETKAKLKEVKVETKLKTKEKSSELKAERPKAEVKATKAVEKAPKEVKKADKTKAPTAPPRVPKLVSEHDNSDDDDDDEGPPVMAQATFDDDDDDDALSFVIQNAIKNMKKVDEELDEPEVAVAPKKAKAKPSVKPSVKVEKKPLQYVAPVDDDMDMGAAFDDEPPKKKTKTGDRLKASDHRRIRQQQKKEALQRLKAKKEIEVK